MMTASLPKSPTATQATLRQCGWCGRLADRDGRYGTDVRPRLREASHGICPPCGARFRAEVDARYATV